MSTMYKYNPYNGHQVKSLSDVCQLSQVQYEYKWKSEGTWYCGRCEDVQSARVMRSLRCFSNIARRLAVSISILLLTLLSDALASQYFAHIFIIHDINTVLT